MSDLDAAIRERMDLREPIAEWPGFAWDVVQALRVVLDRLNGFELASDYPGDVWDFVADELRYDIARELGVSDE